MLYFGIHSFLCFIFLIGAESNRFCDLNCIFTYCLIVFVGFWHKPIWKPFSLTTLSFNSWMSCLVKLAEENSHLQERLIDSELQDSVINNNQKLYVNKLLCSLISCISFPKTESKYLCMCSLDMKCISCLPGLLFPGALKFNCKLHFNTYNDYLLFKNCSTSVKYNYKS